MRVQLILALLLLSIMPFAFGNLPYVPLVYVQATLADTIDSCQLVSLPDPVTMHFAATMERAGLQQYDVLTFSNEYDCFYAKTLVDIDGYSSSSLDSHVKSALVSIPMVGHMPETYEPYWLVYDRYMINGYDWSQRWNIETGKWNKTQAAEEAMNCYHKAGQAVLGLDLNVGWNPANRYYDENGQTLDILNKLGRSSDALAIWNYLNSAHWNGEIYAYKPGSGFECEVGPFAMLIGYYRATNPTIPYFDRIVLDLYNKMLKNGWNSPAWSSSPGVMQHASTNSELRLENTLNGFVALQAYYCLGSTDYRQAFHILLTDSPKAWEALINSPLYSSGKFSWRTYQNTSDPATASGMMLLLLEGIVPDTGCLAIPLNEWKYQDQATMLPYTHFRFDYGSRRIRIPVFAGSINFQFGTSLANATFPSNGIYEVQFSPDWNDVAEVTFISPLNEQFHYLLPIETPPTPPSAQTIYVRSDGTVDPPTASLKLDGNTCIFTSNIVNQSIVIERDSVVVDGVDYTLQGPGLLSVEAGLYLTGRSNVTIRNLDIKEFRYGISIWSSSGNFVFGNNITNNLYGVFIYSSSGNAIFHNNFLDNANQVISGGSVNVWDNGYPSGGNYWANHAFGDLRSGPYQNLSGSDGIGDMPHFLPASNLDRYPHVKPCLWDLRDVGITCGATSKTLIGKGSNVTVSLMMFNYGNTEEEFDLSVYANLTPIYSATKLVVENRSCATVRFDWNTSNFARACNLTANITILEGETDLSDNAYTLDLVKITCIGDVDGNYVTDGKDLVLVKKNIPSTTGSPSWNANLDTNDDGVVGAKDYQIVKNHIPSILP